MPSKMQTHKVVIGVPSKDTLTLESYLAEKSDGDFITYKELETVLGFDVRKKRGIFYTACKRLGRECLNKPNFGYQLSSSTTALPIVNGKVERIVSSSKRMVVSAKRIRAMHSQDLTGPQIQVLDNCEFTGDAIAGNVRSMKKIIRTERPQLSAVSPSI
jgi:hypothetical protein